MDARRILLTAFSTAALVTIGISSFVGSFSHESPDAIAGMESPIDRTIRERGLNPDEAVAALKVFVPRASTTTSSVSEQVDSIRMFVWKSSIEAQREARAELDR